MYILEYNKYIIYTVFFKNITILKLKSFLLKYTAINKYNKSIDPFSM